MADSPNTVTTFAGFLKTRYAQNVVNTIPEDFTLQTAVPFKRSTKIGEQYQQSVITRWEQGGTYSRGGQSNFALKDAIAGSIEKALVDGYQFVMKSAIDYETLSKAISKSEIAYGSSGDQLLRNMAQSTRRRQEIDLWSGQFSKGIGEVESVAAAVYTIKKATWAPGNFIGMEKARIEAFTAALTTQRTGTPSLDAVDPENYKVTMSAAHTSIAATDVLFFETQRTTSAWNSMLGILGIAGTTSGTLWNINVTNSSIFRPNAYTVGGDLNFRHVQNMAIRSKFKSLVGGATIYCSIYSFNDLLDEQAALRRYGGEFAGRTKLTNGGEAIEFWSVAGRLMIMPSIYCPIGYAIVCPKKKLIRTGATDVTFSIPGFDNVPNVHIPDASAGISLRNYYNQALFLECPGQLTLGSGITSRAA